MFDSIEEIEEYIKDEFQHFGIPDWGFSWNKRKTRVLGQAFLLEERIEMSLKFVVANFSKPEFIRDVILHEIAHALAYIKTGHCGHGVEWVHFCNITGAKPTEFISGTNRVRRENRLLLNDGCYELV